MSNALRGVIRGRMIELVDDPEIEDGRGVEVTIRAIAEPDARVEAIRRTAGAMAGDSEFDVAMDEVARQRRSAQFRDLAP